MKYRLNQHNILGLPQEKLQLILKKNLNILQIRANSQTVYAEFEGEVSKSILTKIKQVKKVEKIDAGWLIEGNGEEDLRKIIAQFAQQNNILVLTLRVEEKTLEEVFKELTK